MASIRVSRMKTDVSASSRRASSKVATQRALRINKVGMEGNRVGVPKE
jgi:hypothetical protein